MTLTSYLLHSIRFYRKLNLSVILGIALATAILVGALLVGDSVKYSLQQIALQRLGKTTQVITAGERLFTEKLAENIASKSGAKSSSLLYSKGFALLNGGETRINQIAVWGIDSLFCQFANQPDPFQLEGNQIAINEELAQLYHLNIGDEFLLSINKLNTFPANTPFVSVKDNNLAFRVVITKILSPDQLGNLNLRNSQSSPRNIFLNLSRLNKEMGLQGKANVILLAKNADNPTIPADLQASWRLADLNLHIRENQLLNYTELISDRVFVEPALEKYCLANLPNAKTIFSYFANSLTANQQQTPYSFISSDPKLKGAQMAVNQWLAEDLKLKIGDSIRVAYFQIGIQRQLVEKEKAFRISEIYEIKAERADRNLMPLIPGLSDAGNCRDWKTGVPVDLKKIRTKDEAYWKQYSGIPKAYVALETAQKLWGNRFGQATAIRQSGLNKDSMEQVILRGLNPESVGFEIRAVREEGLQAAAGGVDFGQLFIGLSFFVLFAAILLTLLLFKLFLNYRKPEIGILFSLGFPVSKIRALFLTEAAIYLTMGILPGIPLAIGYNHLILLAINTIWVDIVRTSIVQVQISAVSLLTGSCTIFSISLIAIGLSINKSLKLQLVQLRHKTAVNHRKSGYLSAMIGWILIVSSLILLFVKGVTSGEIDPELFFMSGFLLLPGIILLTDYYFRRLSSGGSDEQFSLSQFRMRRRSADRSRLIQTISFLSVGIFLVVSTGLNRKDVAKNAALPSSATGGYQFWIETAIPVLNDPSTPAGLEELDLPEGSRMVSFQVQPGDDASCLNLNKIARPRIIACDPGMFDQQQAFSFASRSAELDEQHPWLSLTRKLEGQVIPVVADQTVIQWGLMKKTGDTLLFKNEEGKALRLKLIGGLNNSIFQGNILMDATLFAQQFPSVSGSSLFLLQLPEAERTRVPQLASWRSRGTDIMRTTDRLLQFYQIENTYLNIFLMLGALGLLIGTVGLGILIFRTIRERISEFALLSSLGFQRNLIYRLVLRENLWIILISLAAGMIPAMISGLPTLLSGSNPGLWIWIPIVATLVALSGLVCTWLAVRMALAQNPIPTLRND